MTRGREPFLAPSLIPGIDLIQAPLRQTSALSETDHRPWPLPGDAWILAQTCDDLLFAHWRVAATDLRPYVPERLAIDERNGSAWLGMTPFVVTGLRARGTFPLPFVSSLRQLNVRTYVTHEDKPGIWFFSLDASSQLAVEAARRVYKLPSFHARISLERRGGRILYECVRDETRAFSGSYGRSGRPAAPRSGTLDHFLTERYCLYAAKGNRLWRAEIHHRPWQLQQADAAVDLNTMAPDGVELEGDPLFHFSGRQDIVIWPLRELT